MIKLIQKATASSKDGAVGLIKGIIACCLSEYGIYAADRTFILFGQRFTRRRYGRKNSFLHSRLRYMLCAYINYNLVSV